MTGVKTFCAGRGLRGLEENLKQGSKQITGSSDRLKKNEVTEAESDG